MHSKIFKKPNFIWGLMKKKKNVFYHFQIDVASGLNTKKTENTIWEVTKKKSTKFTRRLVNLKKNRTEILGNCSLSTKRNSRRKNRARYNEVTKKRYNRSRFREKSREKSSKKISPRESSNNPPEYLPYSNMADRSGISLNFSSPISF